MKRADPAECICGYCRHLSTKAATDDPAAIEEAAKLAAAGIGRCQMLSTDRGQILTVWDTRCIHFDRAPDVDRRRVFVEKQMAKQQEAV